MLMLSFDYKSIRYHEGVKKSSIEILQGLYNDLRQNVVLKKLPNVYCGRSCPCKMNDQCVPSACVLGLTCQRMNCLIEKEAGKYMGAEATR